MNPVRNLKTRIQNDLKKALKKKETLRVSVMKMLLSSVLNEEIKLKKKEEGLTDEEIFSSIKSEAKKRQDAIEAYTKADRKELAEQEKKELSILGEYLPEELSDEKIEKIVKEVIEESKANSMQDFGKIMKESMVKIKGQADGKRVSETVKKFLEA